MQSKAFTLMRYDADEGMVFDWAEPRYTEVEEGSQVQEHLYAKTLFIGSNDSIENYIEVALESITGLVTGEEESEVE